MLKRLKSFSVVMVLTGFVLVLTGCGKKTPSSRLHCTAAADCESFSYCDVKEIVALLRDVYQSLPDSVTEDVARSFSKDFKVNDKKYLDDLVEAVEALDPKVFVSSGSLHDMIAEEDFKGMRMAIQLEKGLPVYKLYKAIMPIVASEMDEMPMKASMPSTGENILLISSDKECSKMETALEQKGKDTFPSDMLEGVPQESILYAASRVKDLTSMLDGKEKFVVLGNDLHSVVRDAKTVNYAVLRSGKKQVACHVNVFYEDKKTAKDNLDVVKKTLKDLSKKMDNKDYQVIREFVGKVNVSRAGKSIHLEWVWNIPTQKEWQKVFDEEKTWEKLLEDLEEVLSCVPNFGGHGNSGAVQKEIAYQRARAEKVGKYVAENFADKKILILTLGDYKDSYGEVIPNHLLEGLKKGLGGVGYEVLARPVPEEGTDEAMEEMEWRMKHLDNLMMGKDYKGRDIPGYSPVGDFNLLITTIGLPEDAFRGGKPMGKLAGKSVAFVQGYTEKWAPCFKNKSIVVAALDKQYPGESNAAGLREWEQDTPSDLDKAFDVRYILKTY